MLIGALAKRAIGVNLAIFDNISLLIRVDAAPTGLGSARSRFSTKIPSLRDSRDFEGFKVSAENPVRLGNRTYRAWGGRVFLQRYHPYGIQEILKASRFPRRIRFG